MSSRAEIKAQILEAYRQTELLEAECARNYSPELEARCNAASKAYYDLCDQHPDLAPRINERES